MIFVFIKLLEMYNMVALPMSEYVAAVFVVPRFMVVIDWVPPCQTIAIW